MFQELVVLRVGQNGRSSQTHLTYLIAKDSYGWENVIFIIKSSYELRSMLWRGACKAATPVVGM